MGEGLGVSIRHRTAAAVVAAFLLGAGLTACNDDGSDEPADSGLPSDSETSGSSPTPTQPSETGPTPPEPPDAADGTGPKAAEAFVRHYVDLINYAGKTFDASPLQAASGDACENCTNVAKTIVDMKSDGTRLEGGRISVVSIDPIPGQPDTAPIMDVVLRSSRQRLIQPGQKPEVTPSSKSLYTWYLRRASTEWKLVRWDVVQKGV